MTIQRLIQQTQAKPDLQTQETTAKPERSSLLAFIAADNVDDDTSEDSEAQEQTEALMGLETAPADAIDWDSPLTAGAVQQSSGESLSPMP